MNCLKPVSFRNVTITDGFWAAKQKLNSEVTVYSVRDRFKDTGRFEAFKFNYTEGSDIPRPHFFWDSDVAKWLESVFYIIAKHPDDELLADAENVIDLIEKNQCEDGYFNIYHTLIEPELRFKNRDHHELYCLGHLLEAAVACTETTGDNRFFSLMDRYVDLVIRTFTIEKSAEFTTPGHEEIELALIKAYRLTNDKKYLDLASFFIDNRGVSKEYTPDWANANYYQSEKPVREFTEANGHAVRACYLYSGMADVARETGDEELFNACKRIFDDITSRKMYVTGGVGSSHHGEAFTVAYDLPNDVAYNETCAAIALSFFADRMKDIDFDSRYADIVELEMYNGALSGLSLDGKAFFYENPLEINLIDRVKHVSVNDGDRLPITQRLEVFGCSCCPPNMTRYIASIGGTIFSCSEDSLFIHQYMNCEADADGTAVAVKTAYPADGKVQISVKNSDKKYLYFRVPGWCRSFDCSAGYVIENGYAKVCIGSETEITVNFKMQPSFVYASPKIRAISGMVCVKFGPVVYCAEKKDNPYDLFNVLLDTDSEMKAVFDPAYNCSTLSVKAAADDVESYPELYSLKKSSTLIDFDLKMIPYFAFANRGESDMRVWFRIK